MKKSVICAWLLLGLTLTPSHAAIDSWLRFTQATGLLAPLSQAWNLLNDYEEIVLTCGLQTYHSDFTDYYYGASTRFVRDAWLDPFDNRTVHYRTQSYYSNGQTGTDYNAFMVTSEKRTYVCVRYALGKTVAYQTVSSDTTFWLTHTVARWPTQVFNTGPASISVAFAWIFNQLATGCDQYPPGNLWTLSSHTVNRNSTRRDIPMPLNNIEITGLTYGWMH